MKLYKITILTLALFLITGGVAFGQTEKSDSTLEETKQKIEELVVAKDEKSPLDLGLRVETFKKVVDLSISEAKDLKVDLLAIDNMQIKDLDNWRERVINSINESVEYYEKSREDVVNKGSEITVEEIQQIATEFKNWRESQYMEINNQVQNFILISREKDAIETTNRRWNRINDNLINLKNEGYVSDDSDLWPLLDEAKKLIEESEKANNNALEKFYSKYVNVGEGDLLEESTSNETNSTSTIGEAVDIIIETSTSTDESVATSTDNTATSSIEETSETLSEVSEIELRPDSLELSIEEEIRLSLEKMREAYQIFIEMSSSVRELLN